MSSKNRKIKKALAIGFGAAMLGKGLKAKGEMKEFLKTEGGNKAKIPYITKKAPIKQMMKKKVPSNILTGIGDAFGLGMYDGAKKGKMIKARGGKMVKTKPTKLY